MPSEQSSSGTDHCECSEKRRLCGNEACDEKHPEKRFICTRPPGHDSPHSACTPSEHPLEWWGQDDGLRADGGEVEDDTEQFTHADLNCKIVQTDMGHWCGYVQIPDDDDLGPVRWTSDYDSKHGEVLDAEVDAWGGITYGPDDDGWVGFDDAHSRSLVDHREFDTSKDAVKNETQRLADQIRSLHTGTDRDGGDT